MLEYIPASALETNRPLISFKDAPDDPNTAAAPEKKTEEKKEEEEEKPKEAEKAEPMEEAAEEVDVVAEPKEEKAEKPQEEKKEEIKKTEGKRFGRGQRVQLRPSASELKYNVGMVRFTHVERSLRTSRHAECWTQHVHTQQRAV